MKPDAATAKTVISMLTFEPCLNHNWDTVGLVRRIPFRYSLPDYVPDEPYRDYEYNSDHVLHFVLLWWSLPSRQTKGRLGRQAP
jgi:hypothetical protein